jgi:L-fucose isomerase-like protein
MDVSKSLTFGLIIGNRGFFPEHLCQSARIQIVKTLKENGIKVIALDSEQNNAGSVETLADARKCADLFSKHHDKIDGVIVTLPNFGDERAVANSLRWSGLNVPILVHAYPDDITRMQISDRRDSFCGKISVCNNLRQYGIKFSLTDQHVVDPESKSFQDDLQRFLGICRVYKGFKNLRVGLIGARPAAFNTVRFSEILFERSRISVEPIDLAEIINRTGKYKDNDEHVLGKVEEIRQYIKFQDPSATGILRLAKLGIVIDQWMTEQELSGMSIQCWTALEEIYGVVPCTLMSMMSNSMIPSACETDISGLIGMIALANASGRPSGIVDWNNNLSQDEDKCVVFHCSNLPKDLLIQEDVINSGNIGVRIKHHDILSGGLGKENRWGTVAGRLKPGPVTYCRVSTDDLAGKIRAYVGEGEITSDPVETFGGYGVLKIQKMKELLHYICDNGFEHHVAINPSNSSSILQEVFTKYLEWDSYNHRRQN